MMMDTVCPNKYRAVNSVHMKHYQKLQEIVLITAKASK